MVVLGRAAGLGCRGTVVVVGAGEGIAVGVPRGFGSGVVRRGWAWVPVGVPRPVGALSRRRVPWPVLALLAWWVSGAGDPPCPRGGL